MPDISVELPAIIMAVINQFLLGLVWYGIIFRQRWSREMKVDPDSRPPTPKIVKSMALMIVGNFLMAWVLAHNIAVRDPVSWGLEESTRSGLILAVNAGFLHWLGFFVPILLSAVAWGGKSWTYFAINAGFYLLGLIVMAITIIFFNF